MNQSALKRFALRSFLLFLAFTALVAIISVLTGSFGEVQLRILLTSLTISTASICAMSCAAFIERKDRTILGAAGIICSVAAALVIIFGIWFEPSEDTFWKLSITLVVAAAAGGPARAPPARAPRPRVLARHGRPRAPRRGAASAGPVFLKS